jgi:carbamoyltransferase
MRGAYLGPEFSPEEIGSYLDSVGASYSLMERHSLIEKAASLLASERVVGWFSGRMEFGPRALGGRSILGDPRSPKMQEQMNLKIKFRESFRPFAPTVLEERVGDYFELDRKSPYMLLVAPVKEDRRIPLTEEQRGLFGIEKLNVPRSDIPAITHVNYSDRVQTVSQEDNPDYHDLIEEFERQTGCGVVVNTSFNVRGEPIVCTPEHAYTCFMRTNMDYLVLGPYLLDKTEQPEWKEDVDWRETITLD